jgi:hypothetical protein
MKPGPDGPLYVLNCGTGFCPKNLPGADLERSDYVGPIGDRMPTVTVTADNTFAPLAPWVPAAALLLCTREAQRSTANECSKPAPPVLRPTNQRQPPSPHSRTSPA